VYLVDDISSGQFYYFLIDRSEMQKNLRMKIDRMAIIFSGLNDQRPIEMASGGFAPWSDYWDRKFTVTVAGRGNFNAYSTEGASNYVVICVHGAGHSGLSFSLLAKSLRGIIPFIAIDLKCHGDTPGDESLDLGLDSLVADVLGFCQQVRPENSHLILLGHSLGGSIIAKVACQMKVSSTIVIDTIEGTAVESMPYMKQVLEIRPKSFRSPDACIEYVHTAGEMSNRDSAVVSCGGRFKEVDGYWYWRTELMKCEKDWIGWFQGFAASYLGNESYKVLVLPDINRLDTPFTIAHMSGKFQLEVILNTNHCVHEDDPKHMATMLLKLAKRLASTDQWN
jgi:protein phosphatase methylesterase 1